MRSGVKVDHSHGSLERGLTVMHLGDNVTFVEVYSVLSMCVLTSKYTTISTSKTTAPMEGVGGDRVRWEWWGPEPKLRRAAP